MEAYIDMIPGWITALTLLVTGANAITMLTPTEADNKALAMVLKLLNVLSGNVLKNVNKDAK